MRVLHVLSVGCVVLLLGLGTVTAQFWTPLIHQPTFAASTALLLTDGTVMVHDAGGQRWFKLTPDNTGSYINGTWSQLASLPAGYSPLYYASAVLRDGRVILMGGEYNFFNPVWTNMGAIYNPLTNKWKAMGHPTGWTTIGDAQSTTFFDGTFILANCCSREAAILDPKILAWTLIGTGKADTNNEEGWTLLPNGKILAVDTFNGTATETFDPVTKVWSLAGNTPAPLVEPSSHEIGPAVLRPDGTVFATGATGHNAIYNAGTGVWSAGPDFPKVNGVFLDIADGPGALLPNGNVLVGASPGIFQANTRFFEFDGINLNSVPATPNAPGFSSFEGRMLVLPTGQVMFTDGSSDVEIYTSSGGPNPAWMPVITKVAKVVIHGQGYALKGKQLNGLSAAGEYGDDAQAASNYPLVRITNDATGHVVYARTKNHSSMGVATGNLIVTTHFKIPATIDLGPSHLEVVANGIASASVAVTVN